MTMAESTSDDTDLTIREVPGKPGLLAAYDLQGNHMEYRYYDGHYYSQGT